MRAAQIGMLANTALAIIKLIAGVVGHSYALIADAAESSADILSSLVVFGGLRIASQPADENHPYGHGRAEALAGAIVSIMLLIAAIGIALRSDPRDRHAASHSCRMDTRRSARRHHRQADTRAQRDACRRGDGQQSGDGGRAASQERRDHVDRGIHRNQHRRRRRTAAGSRLTIGPRCSRRA